MKKLPREVIETVMKRNNILSCNYDSERKTYHCTMFDGTKRESIDGNTWYKIEKEEKKMAKNKETCVKTRLVGTEGYQPVSPESSEVKTPKTGSNVKPAPASEINISEDIASRINRLYRELPPTQQKIHEIMGAMTDLLLYKNQKYGDSAINPKKIFYKGDSTNSILIRLDDKIGRVMSNTEEKPRVNDVCDIIGYCTLLLISMGVTAGDIAKFKD